MTEQPKSWRDVLPVHPAAGMFPMMAPDELKALGEDIKKNGLTTPIALWSEKPEYPPQYSLLDGRNRLDAMEAAGLSLVNDKDELHFSGRLEKHEIVTAYRYDRSKIVSSGIDPYDYVLSANLHRRHLTAEQRRDIAAAVLKAQPEKSNRTIAKQAKVDDKTVAAIRDKLTSTAEIPRLTKTVGADGKARTTAPKKKRRDVEDHIAETKARLAAKDAAAPAPAQFKDDEVLKNLRLLACARRRPAHGHVRIDSSPETPKPETPMLEDQRKVIQKLWPQLSPTDQQSLAEWAQYHNILPHLGEQTTPQQTDLEDCIAEHDGAVKPILDDIAKLPFIVRQGDRIIAAFAKRADAHDWARFRSVNYSCRCNVSSMNGVLDAFKDGQSVDA